MVTAEWDDAAPSSKEIAQAIAWHLAALYGPPPPKGAACREGQVLIRVGEVQAALTVSGRTKLERSRISDLGGSLGVSITSPAPPGMALHTRRSAALVDLLQTSVVQRHGGRHHERSVALVLDLPAPPALIDGIKAWQPLQRRRRMPQDATKRLQDWDSWLAVAWRQPKAPAWSRRPCYRFSAKTCCISWPKSGRSTSSSWWRSPRRPARRCSKPGAAGRIGRLSAAG